MSHTDTKKRTKRKHNNHYKDKQFYTKKLNVKQGTFYWNGSKVGRKGTTFNSYRNQPWEVEAYDGQSGLTRKVIEAMIISNVDF